MIQTYLDKIPFANEAVMKLINQKVNELNKQKEDILNKTLEQKVNNSIDTTVLDVNFTELSMDQKRNIAHILIDNVMVGDDTINVIFKV